ncbi:NAD(P)H-hydrate dehydratase [Plebeiibacterium sediminum]|uniref:Bifunctional NAD(P)H-hydrate repair enzyme n=1 Tax=Plebeiibacterium sediminum TaxID=2992112 RepID=A0AAE3M317_9BACT|nr:NAD(P)H-hydrate dehydratase [Plebeiobacterium sediminum]MCW3785904.1 NAD(P)H-hydrate dehydratase [Plebeiobacterium sediminum]
MKILSPEQIREVDLFTIKNEPIPSIDLMERAAQKATDWIISNKMTYSYAIFCGTGNNGGDGLAIARLLSRLPVKIDVFLIKFSDNLSSDAQSNLSRLIEISNVSVYEINNIVEIDFNEINEDGIILDCIFGSGLNRATKGLAKEVIEKINETEQTVISIDIPSGLFANYDSNFRADTGIIEADITLSFQLPKLSFLLPENAKFVGKWEIIDIGLLQEGIDVHDTNYFYTDNSKIKSIVKSRHKFSHKGNFGHALLIAGSYGKMGAAVLASRACLKSGVGLLTSHIPHWGYQIMQNSVPEAMTSIDRSEMFFTEFPALKSYNAIGIGPGLDTKKNSATAFEELLNKVSDQKMVIDADGLNILSQNKFLLVKLPKLSILTPHPKEFERLVGKSKNEMHRLELLQDFCKHYNVITVLKGAHTVVALPDGNCYFNSSGNPGMATAGSGDTLTGIILALLAQGYSEKDAALTGVYIHGLAGDHALLTESEESLIASDIISNIGSAFKSLHH